jgi:hypothetical protein
MPQGFHTPLRALWGFLGHDDHQEDDMTAATQTTLTVDRPAVHLRLRELPDHETPRGRIRDCGPTALSDSE